MKKILILTLIVFLFPLGSLAAELGLPEVNTTLYEKMQMQIREGSGFRGKVSFVVSGDSYLSSLLGDGLNNAIIEYTYILTDIFSNDWQTTLQVLNSGKTAFQTTMDKKATKLLVSGDLFKDSFVFYWEDFLYGFLSGSNNKNNTPWEPIITQLFLSRDLIWENDMLELLGPHRTKLELWLSKYANYHMRTGENIIEITYEIPTGDVKQLLKSFLPDLLTNDKVKALLNKKLTGDQMQTYFNHMALEYYLLALDYLKLDGSVYISQTINMRGEYGNVSISIPIADNAYQLRSLILTVSNTGFQIKTELASGMLTFLHQTDELGGINGSFRFTPVQPDGYIVNDHDTDNVGMLISASYTIKSKTDSWIDENSKQNEAYQYEISIAPDFSHVTPLNATDFDSLIAKYLDFTPFNISASIRYQSGFAKTSATSVIVEIIQAQEDASFSIVFEGKTASPWQYETGNWNSAKILEREEAIGNIISALYSILAFFTPAMSL